MDNEGFDRFVDNTIDFFKRESYGDGYISDASSNTLYKTPDWSKKALDSYDFEPPKFSDADLSVNRFHVPSMMDIWLQKQWEVPMNNQDYIAGRSSGKTSMSIELLENWVENEENIQAGVKWLNEQVRKDINDYLLSEESIQCFPDQNRQTEMEKMIGELLDSSPAEFKFRTPALQQKIDAIPVGIELSALPGFDSELLKCPGIITGVKVTVEGEEMVGVTASEWCYDSKYPDKCPHCEGPAFIGMQEVDCKNGCRT